MGVSKQKLVKTGMWQVLNTVVILISQIGANAILARYVSRTEFGLMAITNAIVNFATFFSEAGMGDALLQRKVVEPQHKNAAGHHAATQRPHQHRSPAKSDTKKITCNHHTYPKENKS